MSTPMDISNMPVYSNKKIEDILVCKIIGFIQWIIQIVLIYGGIRTGIDYSWKMNDRFNWNW